MSNVSYLYAPLECNENEEKLSNCLYLVNFYRIQPGSESNSFETRMWSIDLTSIRLGVLFVLLINIKQIHTYLYLHICTIIIF